MNEWWIDYNYWPGPYRNELIVVGDLVYKNGEAWGFITSISYRIGQNESPSFEWMTLGGKSTVFNPGDVMTIEDSDFQEVMGTYPA